MKKIIAIILSIFLITAPIYSYAVLPFVVAAAATMTRVLAGNVIKKPAQVAMSRAGMSLVGACKSDPLKCAGLGVGIANLINEIAEDWIIEEVEEQPVENGDINIEIYQINDEQCDLQIAFGDDYKSYDVLYNQSVKKLNDRSTLYEYKSHDDYKSIADNHISVEYDALSFDLKIVEDWKFHKQMYLPINYKTTSSESWKETEVFYDMYYKCPSHKSDKTYMTENEFYNYMQKNLTVNDIKNIYNYDYSQHPNITINNNTTTGDTVNNNLRAPSADDKTVSNDLKNNIENNNINMDNVNDQNCTKNEFGEYDQCGDTDLEPDDPTDSEPDDPTDPEPQPKVCSSSEFTQTVCEFIAYMKGDFDVPDAQPVDINVKQPDQAPSDFDKSYVEFGKVCPSFAPTDIEFGAGSTSFTQSLSIDIQVWCDFAEYINPVVEWAGRFIAFGIIAAAIRNT